MCIRDRCGRGGGTKISEYVPSVVSNNIPWRNRKYVKVAWCPSSVGGTQRIFSGPQLPYIESYGKIGSELFCRKFYVKNFWSDVICAVNASIPRKDEKEIFGGSNLQKSLLK